MLWPLIFLHGRAENSTCVHDSVLLQTRNKGIPLSSTSIHDVHDVPSISREELLDLCMDETDKDTLEDLVGEARRLPLETELEYLEGLTSNKVRVLHLSDTRTPTRGHTHTSTLWQPCSEQQLKQSWVPVAHACLAANLIYIKVPKTASSTTGGIMRRIASRHGLFGVTQDLRLTSPPVHFEPAVPANHGCARCKVTLNQFGLTKPAILITVLRDPVERALSQYYAFVVTGDGSSSKPDEVIEYLEDIVSGSYQLDYIRLDGASGVSRSIESYSFIGIVERLPESLVVLKHLLGLKFCDLLYATSSKVSTDTDEENRTYVPQTWLSQQAPEVRAYVASPEFSKRYEPDLQLYAASNRSLDQWIDQIGRKQIKEDLATFSGLLKQAESQCSDQDQNGKCYWMDAGCNYPCIDSLCEEYSEQASI